MTDDRWIVIPNWKKFQQYQDRDPIFIKDYREQLARDEYRQLSFHLRGILHGLRLSYAASNGQLRDSTLTLTRQLGNRVMRRDLEALNDAGLIAFSASKPLALTRSREKRREDKRTHALTRTKKPAPVAAEAKVNAGAYQAFDDDPRPVQVDPELLAQAHAWLDRDRKTADG